MKNCLLFEKLDQLNPTEDQLRQYMELKHDLYPLPLFVQMPDKTYQIVRKLFDTMDVRGIATEQGIFLFEQIVLDNDKSYRYEDLLPLAQQIHPKARPLILDDVLGKGHNIADLLDENTMIHMTVQKLSKNRGILPYFTSLRLTYFTNENPEQKNIIISDICAGSESFLIAYAEKIPLFIPATALGYDFKVVSQEPKQEKYGLDVGFGIDGCDFPPARPVQEKSEFPLSLFLRDGKGEYLIRNNIPDGCTVEGIALQDTIILRKTIAPCKIDKEEPTRTDLLELAKQVHPHARPLYFAGFPFGGGIVTLLLLDKKRYNKTAEQLKKYGVKMPDINTTLYFIGGDYPREDFVSQINVGWWAGAVRIKCVEEMLLAIPRNMVDPMYH